MKLNEENRNVIVNHRLQKAKDTWVEAKDMIVLSHWHGAANRLYYACYYAVTALLLKNGYSAHTHNGVFALLGKHFVVEGMVSIEQNRLYGTLLGLRQKGDYDDWIVIKEQDVKPLLEPAEKFIVEIEHLIHNS